MTEQQTELMLDCMRDIATNLQNINSQLDELNGNMVRIQSELSSLDLIHASINDVAAEMSLLTSLTGPLWTIANK